MSGELKRSLVLAYFLSKAPKGCKAKGKIIERTKQNDKTNYDKEDLYFS